MFDYLYVFIKDGGCMDVVFWWDFGDGEELLFIDFEIVECVLCV